MRRLSLFNVVSLTLGFGPGGAFVRGRDPLPRPRSAPMTPVS